MRTQLIVAVMAATLFAGCGRKTDATSNPGATPPNAPRTTAGGQFQVIGVGLQLEKRNDSEPATVRGVVPQSPAAEAGIKLGSRILKVDQTEVSAAPLKRCVDLIRGPAGSTVTLQVFDPGSGQTNDIVLTRKTMTLGK
jgi:C-terminal processing protease CtpA/Prc